MTVDEVLLRFDRRLFVIASSVLSLIALLSLTSWLEPNSLDRLMPRYARPASVIITVAALQWVQMLRHVVRHPIAVRATSDGLEIASIGFRREVVRVAWSLVSSIELSSGLGMQHVVVREMNGRRHGIAPARIAGIRRDEARTIKNALESVRPRA